MTYEPSEYWQERLVKHFDLCGVGHQWHSPLYNRCTYEMKTRTLNRALRRSDVSIADKDIVDVGTGTGFWIPYFLDSGARSVSGCDIAEVSVRRLQEAYPECSYRQVDIGSPSSIHDIGEADIVNVWEVLFHIIDDAAFENALKNLARSVRPTGHLFLSDVFPEATEDHAAHVKYRSLAWYRESLDRANLRVLDILPITYVFAGDFGPLATRPRLARMLVNRATVPPALLADRIITSCLPRFCHDMKLMVCKKT